MKNKISACVILAFGFLILLVYGSITIYGMRNQVEDYEDIRIGNTREANDVNLALEYIDDSELGWDIKYSIENSIQTDSNFKTFYYNNYYTNNAPNASIGTSDFDTSKFFDQFKYDIGEITILLSDYYEYLPIDLLGSFDNKISLPLWGENNLYKIKMPEDAALHIKKQYTSYSTEIISVPYVNSILPSAIIDEKLYFTITNLDNQLYYDNNFKDNIEYKLTSGILAMEEGKLAYDNIETIYPIYLENGDNKKILGMTSVKKDKYLALVTLEDENFYIHLYDVKNNVLIKKEKVGEIPSDMIISRFEIISKGDNILANYEYINADNMESRDALKVVGAVYNITDSNEIKSVLENEYYSKLVNEINENYYTDPEDMIYINNKLHLVFRNYDDINKNWERANSIVLLTMDKEEILYFGIIRNSMIEDYTIGDVYYINYSMNNEELIVRNHSRYLSSVKFQD